MRTKLSQRFEIKTSMVGMNTHDGEIKEARILNRVIRVTPQWGGIRGGPETC